MTKGAKMGLKTLFSQKKNARLYRYRLVLYRYRLPSATFCTSCTGTGLTCTGTPVPIFHFFYIYGSIYISLQIGNSSADVKSILVDCLPSRVSLHAHLSPCSYSAQTDCVHGVDNCTSFFRHFHTYHGAHCISGDQGS